MTTIFWKDGEKSRPLRLMRPCPCGCDARDGVIGAGYLTASSKDGHGFSLWIKSEKVFHLLQKALRQEEVTP
mgnify:CR=1 FL=1